MPFITPERRDKINRMGLPLSEFMPGDQCYVHYKKMVNCWRAHPKWTTAHNIYANLTDDPACQLAWQVFFQLHVMPYEIEKRKLNGDI